LKSTEFATTLRGYAAVCVLISHYFGVYWGNQPAVSELTRAPAVDGLGMPSYLLWLHPHPFFNWGAFGVALFFLVSGFVIPYSLERASRTQFIVGRLFRIVPLYAVGFTITLASIFVSTLYFNVDWPYSLKQVSIHYIPGIRDLLWSVNIDGIIWTLEIEVKFYLICLLGVVALRERSIRFFAIPAGVFAVAMFLIGQESSLAQSAYSQIYLASLAIINSAPYLVFMFIGSVFHYAYNGYMNSERAMFFVVALFIGYLAIIYNGPYHAQIVSSANYGLAILVFSFAASYPKFFSASRVSDFFANISYPLYAIHGVAGYVVLRILWDLQFKAWVSLILVTVLAISISWLLHIAVEVPSNKLGKRLAKKIASKPQIAFEETETIGGVGVVMPAE